MRYFSNNKKSKAGKIEKQNIRGSIILTFIIVLIISLFFPKNRYSEHHYEIDDIVQETIIAPFDFPVLKTDEKLKADRALAKKSVPYIFKEDAGIVDEQIEKLNKFIADITKLNSAKREYLNSNRQLQLNQFSKEKNKYKSLATTDSSIYYSLLNDFINSSDFDTTSNLMKVLTSNNTTRFDYYSLYLFPELEQLLRNIYAYSVIDIKRENIISDKIAILQDGEELIESPDLVLTLEEAWRKSKTTLRAKFPKQTVHFINFGNDIIINFLKPNLIYQKSITEKRQEEKINKVPPSFGIVLEDEKIVDANTRVTPDIFQKLFSLSQKRAREANIKGGIRKSLPIIGSPLIFLGQFAIVTIVLSFFVTFLLAYQQSILYDLKMIILLGLIFIMQSGLTFLIVNKFDLSEYAIPIAISAMTLTIFFDTRIAFTAITTLSILIGIQLGGNIYFIITSIFTSSFAIYSVRKLRKRSQIFQSIIFIVLSYLFSITITELMQFSSFDVLKYHLFFGSVNGIVSPFFAYGFFVLLESAFGITTDLTLLELADFNHPVLKRLSREATGTFTHCVTVGNMAEAASDAIGANSLLARVGSYYHDIGKLVKPEYFVENQSIGSNKHDKLTPSLSALIIIKHVKEGLRLAKEYKLPGAIVDFITTHHGTTKIAYFYDKALQHADDHSNINESDFEYPGPKPRTKETGIVMICEAIEAAIRSIDKPTINNISKMIDKIIRDRLISGQLDDCPLTLSDLGKIKGTTKGNTGILPIIQSIHHLRVEYPNQDKHQKTKDRNK